MDRTSDGIHKKRTIDYNKIHSSIKPILYLSNAFGLGPVLIINKNLRDSKIWHTMENKFLNIVMIHLIVFTGLMVTIHKFTYPEKNTTGFDLFNILVFDFMVLSNLTISLKKLGNNFIDIIEKIVIFNELFKLKSKQFSRNSKFILAEVIVVVSVVLTVSVVDVIVNYKNDWIWVVTLIFMDVCVCSEIIMLVQFINFVLLIRLFLNEMNDCLCNINNENYVHLEEWKSLYNKILVHDNIFHYKKAKCNEMKNKVKYNIGPLHLSGCNREFFYFNEESVNIRTLRMLMNIVYEICLSVNYIYGCRMLIFFVHAFLELTWNLYALVICIIDGNSISIDAILWPMLYFLILFCVTGSCNCARNEYQNLSELLQKLLLNPYIQKSTQTEIRYFSEQLRIQQIIFTAYDFFTINFSVLGSMVEAITTLLVILVQYKIL
ncbi:hypothetical protein L9F63_009815 [Diploptera punctata]|uniref:Gustatory receptor n=1 Tax=Diploptera punctata TaxID=6984 RepID=A0AAD8AIL3_DIPPU|nr:hypothetical protein L9F63_009815 [Diploptera punctata]